MRNLFHAGLLLCLMTFAVSCDDIFSPVTPELTGSVTRDINNDITGYSMQITNIHDVTGSYGGPAFFILYYVEGEYSTIPDIEPFSKYVLECPATGEFGYNNSNLSGKYSFWVVGSEDPKKEVNETDPSNIVVLDFSN